MTSGKIRLHHCHQTRSMRVLWLLNELGADFEVVTYPFGAALHAEPYQSVNPVGRVPALEIDRAVMLESGAMAEYLCERFPQVGLGRAPGDPERMAWLQWIHYAETISSHVQALTQQHIMLFDDTMRSPVVMKIEAKRLAKSYLVIEAALTNQPYLLQGGFSAADIGIAQAIWMGQRFARLDGFPATSAWLTKLSERPAFQSSLPPDGAELLYGRDFYEPWSAPA